MNIIKKIESKNRQSKGKNERKQRDIKSVRSSNGAAYKNVSNINLAEEYHDISSNDNIHFKANKNIDNKNAINNKGNSNSQSNNSNNNTNDNNNEENIMTFV